MRKLSLATALTLALTGLAGAQSYPNRPVTFIVPYGAGGPVDTMARTLSEAMRASLGQPVVIENVTGANGTIGVGRRRACGARRLHGEHWQLALAHHQRRDLQLELRLQKDLVPVARLPQNPYIAVVRKDFPAKDFKDMIAWLKANPDKATEGTAGLGSGQHISGVYFQKITGTKFQFVPYKAGSADIIRDIVAGQIDFTFDQAITSLSHIKGGNVKGYAVTSDKRLDAAPDIPTVDEAGAPRRLYLDLVRPVAAEGRAAGGDRQARRSRPRRDGRPGGAQAAARPRPTDSAAGPADRRGACRFHQGRDRQWHPLIKTPESRCSNYLSASFRPSEASAGIHNPSARLGYSEQIR